MSKIIRVEGRTHGERKNLTGMRVLHNDSSVQRMGARHVRVERFFGHELDIFVDGQNQIFAGQRLTFFAAQNVAARVDSGQHAAGRAVQVFVEVFFEPPKAVVIDPDVTEYLRCNLAIRIEALEFFDLVDALQVQGFHLGYQCRILLAGNPGEVT